MRALAIVAIAAAMFAGPIEKPVVVFETEKGRIEIEVDADRAPITAANFPKYVESGFYDGGVVNRAVRADNTVRHDVKIEVIQSSSATGPKWITAASETPTGKGLPCSVASSAAWMLYARSSHRRPASAALMGPRRWTHRSKS